MKERSKAGHKRLWIFNYNFILRMNYILEENDD